MKTQKAKGDYRNQIKFQDIYLEYVKLVREKYNLDFPTGVRYANIKLKQLDNENSE